MPSPQLDRIAQRRALMVLSVLSGEKTVSEAVAEAEISRGHYYLLENRALKAMLEALAPGAGAGRPVEAGARIAELERQLQRTSREKRRADRMLELTRKLMPRGPYRVGPGRPRRHSTQAGSVGSPEKQERRKQKASGGNGPQSGSENSPASKQ
jgi:hypothetical protein